MKFVGITDEIRAGFVVYLLALPGIVWAFRERIQRGGSMQVRILRRRYSSSRRP
jgi:hypothetical protein